MAKSKSHDTLGRRKRNRRSSTGKHITPQQRDLLWFQKLHEHGPLSSGFLHSFSKHLCRSEKRALDRLTDLYNEDQTKHGGPYLTRPFQQFDTYDARYKELVYDLDKPATTALEKAGLFNEYAGQNTGHWRHKFMVANITASIELATLDNPNLNYIPQHQILERANADLRYLIELPIPRSKRTREVDLIPDALFGLEYLKGTSKTYRIFLVEADRGTEPTRTSQFNRKSHQRNFQQYREYIGKKLYKSHLSLKSGLLVLNVTKDQVTLDRMMGLGEEFFEKGNTYMLFQKAEVFAGNFSPPKPLDQFLTQEWQRISYENFRIDQP